MLVPGTFTRINYHSQQLLLYGCRSQVENVGGGRCFCPLRCAESCSAETEAPHCASLPHTQHLLPPASSQSALLRPCSGSISGKAFASSPGGNAAPLPRALGSPLESENASERRRHPLPRRPPTPPRVSFLRLGKDRAPSRSLRERLRNTRRPQSNAPLPFPSLIRRATSTPLAPCPPAFPNVQCSGRQAESCCLSW